MPIAVLRPTGPGSRTEWTPSAGTNWQAAAASGGAFVSGAAAGLRDRYAMENLPADATGVSSVTAYGMIGASSITAACRWTLDLAGVESNGASFDPAEGGYDVASTVFPLAPGGLAWTVARVNAIEAGPDTVGAPDTDIVLDEFWLLVDYTTSAAAPPRLTEPVFMPPSEYRAVALSDDATADLPDDANRSATLPTADALDTPFGGEVSPAVELDEEGF